MILLFVSKNEEAWIETSIHLYRVLCLVIGFGPTRQLPANGGSVRNFIPSTGGGPAT